MKLFKYLTTAALISAVMLTGCGAKEVNNADSPVQTEANSEVTEQSDSTDATSEGADIKILYTNDIHSYIANVINDEEGNVIGDGMRFSKIAAMAEDMRADGENVLLVDAGDELQGDIYGAMDEGETIIKLMRETGYQLATPGNHDFDYGVTQFLKLAETAGFPYITCNFHQVNDENTICEKYHMFDIGGKKVAFVGISTPATLTSSTPVYFQDEKGDFIYTFDGLDAAENLYASVQQAVDEVRGEADYVIALGHLGVGMDAVKYGWDSKSVIENVSGLDAFIDGHSHTVMEGEQVLDKEGKEVTLTQTGCYLNTVGEMTLLADGGISTRLIEEYDREDEKVAALEQEWIEEIDSNMNEKIAVLDNSLYICNPENDRQRLIRARELNSGDFTADSIYWFFNDRVGIGCDVAFCNGGGIRSSIEKGDITYLLAKQVEPFGNMICAISATGQQILDALEMGASDIGEWDEEWDSPAENGGFLQVAGMSYTIDAAVPTSVETDENGMFKSVNGDYRVKDVKIYNKESGEYEDMELDKSYTLGGSNYILRNGGNGLSMFEKAELTVDYVGLDYVILSEYIKSFESNGEYPQVNTANSPLSKYEGYKLDYENPYGAERINIIME